MIETIHTFLQQHIAPFVSAFTFDAIELLAVALTAVVAYYLTRLVVELAKKAIDRTPTTWDDDILNPRLLRAISMLTPAIVVYVMLPKFVDQSVSSFNWVDVTTRCYILWTVIYIICTAFGNLYNALSMRPKMRPYAVKGVFQMVKLLFVFIGAIFTVSILIGRSPMSIVMALGASAAILMLVFKDTILGLVASVQLTANKMLHKGDWIVVPKHDANGEVVDVSLTTVKVRNWDNSITTIPPYSLVSESFRNYQPMRRSGGRRVDRSVLIDANSVRFLEPHELDRLSQLGLLTQPISDQPQINLRLVRRYLQHWLEHHPQVRHDMLIMVRQMEPTAMGLPLQLYFFARETRWQQFESIQSDIFDEVYALLSAFSLKVYQVTTK